MLPPSSSQMDLLIIGAEERKGREDLGREERRAAALGRNDLEKDEIAPVA